MNRKIAAFFIAVVISVTCVQAQTPVPVVVPATSAPAVQAQTAPAPAGGTQAVMQTLQQMKATNAETLRRQQATLQQLDELEKAIEQIKIFSKRT